MRDKTKSVLTTHCYLEKDGSYLMLHRVSKKNDVNKDKWIGVGGHFEEGESPEECLCREVYEETGISLFPGNSEESSHSRRKVTERNTCVFTLLMNLPAHRKNATKVNWNGFQKKSLRISTCGQATVSLIN